MEAATSAMLSVASNSRRLPSGRVMAIMAVSVGSGGRSETHDLQRKKRHQGACVKRKPGAVLELDARSAHVTHSTGTLVRATFAGMKRRTLTARRSNIGEPATQVNDDGHRCGFAPAPQPLQVVHHPLSAAVVASHPECGPRD